MTLAQKNKQLLLDKLQRDGWTRDQWGAWRKTTTVRDPQTKEVVGTRQLKIKMSKLVVKVYAKPADTWVQRSWAYYADLKKLPNGRIKIGRVSVGKIEAPEPVVGPNVTLTSFLDNF